ncbi:MAG: hypothetical protein SVV80_03560 [Planctomycetota bacterium]|nr:hypothetical protein [Planctomycetota bacterium]
MGIDFDKERWERTSENYRRWWTGELDRPLIKVSVSGRDPGRTKPKLPDYRFIPFYDSSIAAEAIIDRRDYNLSCCSFPGDAFPSTWLNFGAGVVAAFMGANLECGNDTAWFHPPWEQEIANIHFRYDPDNYWLKRVKDLARAAIERWDGLVQTGMTDLGGNLDVLSTFRPSERLLLDLYDHPEDVNRLAWESHELWFRYYTEINEVLQPVNPGYSDWADIYSPEPSYMLQCDFCYMIGPEMFDEFVKPELSAACKRLKNPFYHLDGPGQLAHLDSLLEIPELKGVQWIPGDGSPGMSQWPEVYRKIRAAGKLIQLYLSDSGLDVLNIVSEQVGSAEGIILCGDVPASDETLLLEFLERYDAI